MRDTIHQLAVLISDHGNAAISKGLHYFGITGASVGGVTWATQKGDPITHAGMTLSDWGAIVGIIGGVTLVIKSGVDIYFAFQRNKREKESHEAGK